MTSTDAVSLAPCLSVKTFALLGTIMLAHGVDMYLKRVLFHFLKVKGLGLERWLRS